MNYCTNVGYILNNFILLKITNFAMGNCAGNIEAAEANITEIQASIGVLKAIPQKLQALEDKVKEVQATAALVNSYFNTLKVTQTVTNVTNTVKEIRSVL